MRHTFAAWAIAAGLPTFEIAETMGTSLDQSDKTYGHLLPDSANRARAALDSFSDDAAHAAEGGIADARSIERAHDAWMRQRPSRRRRRTSY